VIWRSDEGLPLERRMKETLPLERKMVVMRLPLEEKVVFLPRKSLTAEIYS
jgi:hypothetical protein